MPNNKLQNKFILFIAGGALFIAVSIYLSIIIVTNSVIYKGGLDALYNIHFSQRTAIENLLLSDQKRVADFASDGYIRDFVQNYKTNQNLTDITEHLIRNKKEIGKNIVGINLYDMKGNTIASTKQEELSYNVSSEKHFLDSIRDEYGTTNVVFSLGDLHFTLDTKEHAHIIISSPLKSRLNREDIGVISIFFDTSELDILTAKLNSKDRLHPAASQSYLVDKSLRIISGTNPEQQITYPTFQTCVDKIDNLGVYKNSTNQEVLGVATCIYDESLLFVTEMTTHELGKYTETSKIILPIFLLFSVIVITFLIRYLFTKNITNKLTKLNEGIKKLELNDFDIHIESKGDNEIDQVITGFNILTKKLRAYYISFKNELESKTQKLKQTIEELESKNEILQSSRSAMYNIFEDIETEKKNAKNLANELKKFQLAVENTSSHIIFTDKNGKILFANNAVTTITGYTHDEIIGNTPSLWGKQMSPEFYKKFWHTISVEKVPFMGEVTNKRKNGELYIAKATINPILDDKGDVLFYVGLEEDITKQKEVDKMKTEFVSLASHQLKTPLSAIKWYSEMLLNGDGGELTKDQETYLTEIFSSNDRMIKLVNALLNVSRIDMGTFQVIPVLTDITEIADIVINELKPNILEKKLNLHKLFEFNNKIPLDPDLTKIILQNLISNAVKYTPENGKILVKISADEKYLNIEVADNGYGISQAQQDKVFQKLFRADNIKSKVADGTGLGLYLVKSIVDTTGGNISFSSKENVGTIFKVQIPLSGMTSKEGTKKLETTI